MSTTPVPDSLNPDGLFGPDAEGTFYGPLSAVPTENWMVRSNAGALWSRSGDTTLRPSDVVQARRRSFHQGDIVHYPHGSTMVVLAEVYGSVLWVVPQEAQRADKVFTAKIAEVELGPAPESDPDPAPEA